MAYLAIRSNLLPSAFKWEFLKKVDFLKTVEAKVIILTSMCESFQDNPEFRILRLTFHRVSFKMLN